MINLKKKNFLDQKKQVDSLISHSSHLLTGVIKEKLNVSEQKVNIDDFSCHHSSPLHQKKSIEKLNNVKEKSVIVESQLLPKKKILKDKLSSLELNTLNMKLSKTLDQVSTLKEKDLKPFWTMQSKEISKKLWLPTKIDCVDSVLNSSKESFKNTLKGKSWFSIKKKHPHMKNLLMTSFQSSLFSHPDYMDLEAVKLKTKSEKQQLKKEKKKTEKNTKEEENLKTLKFRLFPSDKEKEQLKIQFEQFRWYYNSTITIFYNHYGYNNILNKNKYSNYTVRDLLRKYDYVETETENLIIKDYVLNETKNEMFKPLWWDDVHSRLPRGAVNKFVSSINSAISNFKNKNVQSFRMKYRSKKNSTDYLHFEDKSFPSYIKNIKGRYFYKDKNNKRKKLYLKDFNFEKGIEIIYEKETDKYFLHVPVDSNWFPIDDKRNDNQIKFKVEKENRIISLDPGVRKFLVGYDPAGSSIFIGEKANNEILNLFHTIDKCQNKKEKFLLWKKVKNMISELHWKTISFLIENYDTILLPEFKVSEMVKKKKLSRSTKRMMMMFSFFSFKQKLKWKCDLYGKKLIIVDESYTSCTCTNCGTINKTEGKETLKCYSCEFTVDRDVAGARNILIKNVILKQ